MRPIPLLRDVALLSLVAGIVFFANLGGARLWDRDEPRNATCAREMLERGDWVVPTFNGALRTHKPIMLYWLMMASYTCLGVSEFAARVPSALVSCATVLVTYSLGLRLFGRRAALWSAIALATFAMMGVTGRAATPDGCLIFFSSAAMAVYVYSVWPTHSLRAASPALVRRGSIPFTQSLSAGIVLYATMGLAVLSKGPVGLILPTAVIGMFCLLARTSENHPQPRQEHPSVRHRIVSMLGSCLQVFAPRDFLRTCWQMRPCLALAVVLLIAGPWYAWVGFRTNGEWLRGFFWEHNLNRAVSPMEGHHGSLLFYPLALLVCCFPWSVLTVPTCLSTSRHLQTASRERMGERDGILFLCCWIGVYVAIFSVAQTKLPSYVAPTFPALALLFGRFLADWEQSRARVASVWWPLGMGILALVGILLGAGIPLAARKFLPHESAAIWLGLVGAIPLVGATVAATCQRIQQPTWSIRVFAISAIALSVALFAIVAPRVSRHQECVRMLDNLPTHPEARLASFATLEPSWVYYAHRTIQEFGVDTATAAAEFLRGNPSAYLIVSDRHWETLEQASGQPLVVLDRGAYFLKDQTLLLVQSRPAVADAKSGQVTQVPR